MKGSQVMLEYEVYVTQTNAQKVFSAVHVVKQEPGATICSWGSPEQTLGTASSLGA